MLWIKRLADKIKVVSAERIREEMVKIFTGPNPHQALKMLSELGILKAILPEIEAMKGVPQPEAFHPEGDVFEHTSLMLEKMKKIQPLSLHSEFFYMM